MITIVALLKAQPGKEALLAEECLKVARLVRENEQGCLMYLPHAAVNNPAEITFIEKYADQEALEVHAQTPYFKQFGKNVKELLAGKPQLQYLKELI